MTLPHAKEVRKSVTNLFLDIRMTPLPEGLAAGQDAPNKQGFSSLLTYSVPNKRTANQVSTSLILKYAIRTTGRRYVVLRYL